MGAAKGSAIVAAPRRGCKGPGDFLGCSSKPHSRTQGFKAVTNRAPQVSPTWDSHNSALGRRPGLPLIGSKDVSPDEHRRKPGELPSTTLEEVLLVGRKSRVDRFLQHCNSTPNR